MTSNFLSANDFSYKSQRYSAETIQTFIQKSKNLYVDEKTGSLALKTGFFARVSKKENQKALNVLNDLLTHAREKVAPENLQQWGFIHHVVIAPSDTKTSKLAVKQFAPSGDFGEVTSENRAQRQIVDRIRMSLTASEGSIVGFETKRDSITKRDSRTEKEMGEISAHRKLIRKERKSISNNINNIIKESLGSSPDVDFPVTEKNPSLKVLSSLLPNELSKIGPQNIISLLIGINKKNQSADIRKWLSTLSPYQASAIIKACLEGPESIEIQGIDGKPTAISPRVFIKNILKTYVTEYLPRSSENKAKDAETILYALQDYARGVGNKSEFKDFHELEVILQGSIKHLKPQEQEIWKSSVRTHFFSKDPEKPFRMISFLQPEEIRKMNKEDILTSLQNDKKEIDLEKLGVCCEKLDKKGIAELLKFKEIFDVIPKLFEKKPKIVANVAASINYMTKTNKTMRAF
jgi:hypothetical protein